MKNENLRKTRLKVDQKLREVPEALTPEQLAIRQQESLFLLQGPEERVQKAKELEETRRKEVIVLQGGQTRTYESYLVATRQPYFPKFPNDVPFYSEMYRVGEIEGDPNEYAKPALVGVLTNEWIYSRFGRTMITSLRARAITNGIRHSKFFQFFDAEGQGLIIKFRDEAIEMLGEYRAGQLYEFRRAYATKYGTSFQLRIESI